MTVDEELRDGLGLCADVCPEITIQIIDRRARPVSDIYRDGPGACVAALVAPCPLRRGGSTHKLMEAAMNGALRGFLVEMAVVLPGARR